MTKKVKTEEISYQEKLKKGFITPTGYDLSQLNPKELMYFRMMYPKSGVLFLTSAPGIAKSAIQRSIAKKMQKVNIFFDEDGRIDPLKGGEVIARSLFYIDLRLAMLDETDVGLFPDKKEMLVVDQNQKEVLQAFLDHIVPKWAFYANNPPPKKVDDGLPYCGTLIHFEELNRAPLAVRNAALQILLERSIGFEFDFNQDVFMVSTGNLGEEDGTDVEEFDSALNGRLIHIEHTMSFEEWVEYWAKDNIQSIIIRYLTAHQEFYYIGKASRTEKDKAYASPRTWEFLSNYITANYGFNSEPKYWLRDLQIIGDGYIGAVNIKFLKYVRDVLKLSIRDILNRYPEIRRQGVKFTRDQSSELLSDLRSQNVKTLKPNEIENCKLFMLDLNDDEVAAYLLKILDKDYVYLDDEESDEEANDFILGFLRDERFEKFNDIMLSHVETKKTKTSDNENDFWSKNKKV